MILGVFLNYPCLFLLLTIVVSSGLKPLLGPDPRYISSTGCIYQAQDSSTGCIYQAQEGTRHLPITLNGAGQGALMKL